jgi:RNA polymerase sigma factor (sigma-70 family)
MREGVEGAMTWDEIEKYIDSQRVTAIKEIDGRCIDVDDALQATRIKVWAHVDKSGCPKSIKAFCQKVLRNTIRDAWRKDGKLRHVDWVDSAPDGELERAYVVAKSTESGIEDVEAAMMVEWATSHLKQDQKESFLAYLEHAVGDSKENTQRAKRRDVADILGITDAAHHMRINRAKKRLVEIWDNM